MGLEAAGAFHKWYRITPVPRVSVLPALAQSLLL